MRPYRKPHFPKSLAVSIISLLAVTGLRGEVRMPALFSDHMVIQRDAAVPIWGWADPGEVVTVEIAGKSAKATANAEGKWMVKVDRPSSKKPTTLLIKGKNTITINDVLIGEVWLASGQSDRKSVV